MKFKHKENKWKSVKFEGAILNDNLEGLIAFEELTDFDCANITSNHEQKVKTKSKKRKLDVPAKIVKKSKISKKYEHCEVGNKKIETKQSISVEDMSAWSSYGLADELIRALGDEGFKQPTQIQSLTLPPAVLGRRDILGAAETGSGKTLAFGLPILNAILDLKRRNIDILNNNNDEVEEDEKVFFEDSSDELEWQDDDAIDKLNVNVKIKKTGPLYALILTPTRELAVQVKNHLKAAAKYTDIAVACIVGGMAAVKQERVLRKCPEIVVATPGRLWDMIQLGNKHLKHIEHIRFLAIDETDRMVERGHFQELHNLLERLNSNDQLKQIRQNFVFSATLTLVHDLPKYLQRKKKLGRSKSIIKLTPGQKVQQFIQLVGMTSPKVVDITRDTGTAGTLTECRITCPIEEKDYYLYYFLKRHPGRTLVFCNSIGCVKRLTTLFTLLQCNPLPLHASMQQRQRLKNLERFRDDEQGVLVATDIAARGLDIPKVVHVIHYQVPRTAENYVHRSGRTARAMAEGITVLFMEPSELKNYIKLCHTLGKGDDLPLFPVADNLLSAVKQRVNLARDLDKLELETKRTNSETGWLQKAINDMDIIVDKYDQRGGHFQIDNDSQFAASKQKQKTTIKRKQLNALLAKPIFPKGFNFKYPSLNNTETITSTKNAIEVMKDAMSNYARSNTNKLGVFRPRPNINVVKRQKKLAKQRRKDAKKKLKKSKQIELDN